MNLKDCIDRAVAGGEMDPARAAEAKDLFDEIEGEYAAALGPEAAALRAGRETVAEVRRQTAIRRRQQLLAAAAEARIAGNIARARMQGLDAAELHTALIDATGTPGLPRSWRSADGERDVVLGMAHARMADLLSRFRRDLAGRPGDKATLLDVVREAHGDRTGNAAASELSKAWYETAEFLRLTFNAAGGAIGRLERWGIPHAHDTVRVRAAGYETWRDFVWKRLDRERMTDGLSGRPFSDARLETALRDVYETIRTDGFSKLREGQAIRARSLANRRTDHRFLHFKTADDWLQYQEEFGTGNAWDAMLGHVAGMAREIGAMRALGPNPAAAIRRRQAALMKEAKELPAGEERLRNRLERTARGLPDLYDVYSGAVNEPGDARIARAFQATRNVLTAAQLGSAALSAITDLNFGRMTAAYNGLPQARLLKRHLSLLNPANEGDRKLAVRLGLIAEEWSQVAAAQARYVGEVQGPEVTQRLADAVLRVSGLSAWTQAGRWAFGMEFMGALADSAAMAFDDLTPAMRRQLQNYGFSAEDWDAIRTTDLYAPDRGGFLRPEDIAARDDLPPARGEELATRLLSMIQTETDFAVPSTSIRGRAALGGASRPGTVPGELIRSGLMYKSFAVTMYFTHVRRIGFQDGGWNKARYAASLLIGTTLMGALAIQLKDMSRGRDPRAMFGENSVAFWSAAMAQGGGLGLFGDFLFADVNRFGQGLAVSIAGPVVGAADDFGRLTIGNLREVLAGEETDAGRELVQAMGRYVPGASIWYLRLALERLALDRLQAEIDPDYRDSWRRLEQRHMRELGSRYFWPKGRLAPERAPDPGNALEGFAP